MQMALTFAAGDARPKLPEPEPEDVSARQEVRPGRLWQCPRCREWQNSDRCGWCGKHRPKKGDVDRA